MTKVVIRTDGISGFFARARDAARRADQGKPFDGRITLSFEDPQNDSSVGSDSPPSRDAELQKLRSVLLAGAASQPTRAVDGDYFQSLRATVATSQLSGLGSSHQNDHMKSKCQPLAAIEDLICGINADNLHEEADFGSPVGKEKL